MLQVYEHVIELNHYKLDKNKECPENGSFSGQLSFKIYLFYISINTLGINYTNLP